MNPSTAEGLPSRGMPIELRDGSRVRVRPGRPTDGDLLLRGFDRSSAESRYPRFLTPMPVLGDRAVRWLTAIDHRDLEALVALGEQDGQGLGVARYVRNPERSDTAEVAVTVVDDWHGRGLGTLLQAAIGGRAREEGIRTFTALMLARNEGMLHLLRRLGPVRIVDRAVGMVEVEVPIPDPYR